MESLEVINDNISFQRFQSRGNMTPWPTEAATVHIFVQAILMGYLDAPKYLYSGDK